ncbi:hypothetical protein [Epilithonimonas vandammei]|jgi:hypothetical protein|uniref:hypothetical protein n=1 Tax=Epilithonimonas vandammei TaxID=2487072 RepID=UPI0028A118B5|nr:hypothetical protein [Epilithonimonas vandammei]
MDKGLKSNLQKFIDDIEPKIIKIDGPDYYVSQSQITINPELLIIGINPAGDKKLSESIHCCKKPENIIYDSNQYLENPDWHISKKLNFIFSGNNARKIYEKSVIINYIAFNTHSESDLKSSNFKEMVEDCKTFSDNLIYNVIKPKKILILGPSLANLMNIKFHHLKDSILRTKNEKSYLVINIKHKDIPHYLIFHPSTPQLNSGENLKMKRDFFETLFS